MITICYLFSFWSIFKQVFLLFPVCAPPLIPSHPSSQDESHALFIFHVQFKWCTPVLQNQKCLLLILDAPLVILCCNQHCPSFLLFSFFFCLLPSHPIVHLHPFGCHTGDMDVHIRLYTVCVCVPVQVVFRASACKAGGPSLHTSAQEVQFPLQATLTWIHGWTFTNKQMTDPKKTAHYQITYLMQSI